MTHALYSQSSEDIQWLCERKALCEHSWALLREVVICEHLIYIFSSLTIQQ